MKTLILKAILATTLISSCCLAGWLSNDKTEISAEKDRRVELESRFNKTEQQLDQQRGITQKWQIASGGLAVGCAVLLIIGAALGAKARCDGKSS